MLPDRSTEAAGRPRALRLAAAALWIATGATIGARIHVVMGFRAWAPVPGWRELLEAPASAWGFCAAFAATWLGLSEPAARVDPAATRKALRLWALACAPILLAVLRNAAPGVPAEYAEPLWFAFFSGWSLATLAGALPAGGEKRLSPRRALALTAALALATAAWWYGQSVETYNDFLLGYNDFGHFAQRVVNTSEGRGFLVESPALPRFWDHFNPGLALLVPLWKVLPSPHLFLLLQAAALALPALAVHALAARLGAGPAARCLWAAAWLAHPALGQLNLAYTYGWHPISLAIGPMLVALWAIAARRPWAAAAAAGLAMSFEEGVIAIAASFAAVQAGLRFRASPDAEPDPPAGSARAWAAAAAALAAAFALVYRFSGLAEFQTGRFVALGGSAVEVALSPVLRPAEFWGQIFRWNKAAYVLSLALPAGWEALRRGWTTLLALVLPLTVLLAWDHAPAACLAFQYSSALLPVIADAALRGARLAGDRHVAFAAGALGTGLVLSLFVGQLPYSRDTLLGVRQQTYGDSELRREAGSEDGEWLTEQVVRVRRDGGEVLATGRIAAHLVGNRDVETVGQFLERRERLSRLAAGDPLRRYRWIVLDRREQFQQTPEATRQVEREGLLAGYRVVEDRYGIVILEAPHGR
jgi:uncharacterized membrane protein